MLPTIQSISHQNKLPLVKRELLHQILQQQGFEDLTDTLETGLLYFLRDIIIKLRKISKQSQCGENVQLQRYCKLVKKNDKEEEDTSQDPFGDYKFAEKRELQFQTFYEGKIQNNREKEEKKMEEEQLQLQRNPNERKKRTFNEDQEILKMLFKMKNDKNKESDTTEKYQENKNIAITYLVTGQNNQKKISNAVQNQFSEQQDQVNTNIIHITHKNLISFMESETYFKKSAYLQHAYLIQ